LKIIYLTIFVRIITYSVSLCLRWFKGERIDEMGGYGDLSREEKKKILIDMLERLEAGEEPWKLKEKFKGFLSGVTAKELSMLEQELIQEGISREKLHRLCDIHIVLFKEQVGSSEIEVEEGHPIRILMTEHKILLDIADELRKTSVELRDMESFDKAGNLIENIKKIADHLKSSESHYLREENVLFPFIEKHGITEPPAIMWMEHDRIRNIKREISKLVEKKGEMDFDSFVHDLGNNAIALAEALSTHFFKENNILFKAAIDVLSGNEWVEIRKGFDELGYCCFSPEPGEFGVVSDKEEGITMEGRELVFETGSFSAGELEALLDTLPVDITFVDRNDRVRYFNQSKDRIFVRTKAVIGRTVQQCHPQKSIDAVNKILSDFKSGKRDHADFWIEMEGKLIYIRYFPVRDRDGDYLGTLEVTQDITEIKKIKGEKRLLKD